MDELIRMVSERAGINEDQARAATETVLGVLQERLPEPVASQLRGLLDSSGGGGGGISDQLKGLGGMLGR
jgi:hypothetical protein